MSDFDTDNNTNDFIIKIDDDVIEIKKNSNKITQNLPWVEKYRPTIIDEIIGNINIKDALNTYLKNRTLPHLLLHGPSGTGKTSIINSYAKQAYGEYYNMMVLQINASEERGIEIIRNKVKNFVITKSIYEKQPFKLVILDEADSMTFSAQSMLRRIIEDYTENARFCLICNKVKNIDLAIQSRCTMFKFSNLNDKDMKKAIIKICDLNSIKYDSDGLNSLIKISRGDMRKAINNLQSISMSYNMIDYHNVCVFFGYPSEFDIDKIFRTTVTNDLEKSCIVIRKIIFDNQYSFLDMINETHSYLLKKLVDKKIELNKFMSIINKLKKIEYNIYICPPDELITDSYVACFF